MSTPLPAPITLSRTSVWRAADALLELAARLGSAAFAARARWLDARRRAAAHTALRSLNPALLRDIGAPDDLLAEAASRRVVGDAQLQRLLRGD